MMLPIPGEQDPGSIGMVALSCSLRLSTVFYIPLRSQLVGITAMKAV